VEPELRVADFAKAGADIISVHRGARAPPSTCTAPSTRSALLRPLFAAASLPPSTLLSPGRAHVSQAPLPEAVTLKQHGGTWRCN